jgi:cell division protein FtsI/penicillin-binding protein 2
LDLVLQGVADELLMGRRGALILLDAGRGEILVMSSTPTFDPNSLDQDWESLVEDPDAPLLNRAAQGQYSPGAALGALLYARALAEGSLPELPTEMDASSREYSLGCALTPPNLDWPAAVTRGCPGAAAALGGSIGSQALEEYYRSLGFYQEPRLRLPVPEAVGPTSIQDPAAMALGENLRLSPLQLALAAATLSADGVRPAPVLALSQDTTRRGWQPLEVLGVPTPVLPPEAARRAASDLESGDQVTWQAVALAPGGPDQTLTWLLAGTTNQWEGAPYVLVLLLEEEAPGLALNIGEALMEAALSDL